MRLREIFSTRTIARALEEDPEIALDQLAALSRHIPILYFNLLVNAAILAVTHLGVAPTWLVLGQPGVFTSICMLRLWSWSRLRIEDYDAARAIRRLRQTTSLTVLLAVGFTLWSLSLCCYGGLSMRLHVAMYMSLTAVTCIFSLMHLPRAAFALSAIIVVPLLGILVVDPDPVLDAISVNIVLVIGGMLVVARSGVENLKSTAKARRELLVRQAAMLELSEQNLRLANMDSLTGLPNRRHFFAAFEVGIEDAAANGKRLALALVDLDCFKSVNDLYGHATGDRLLTMFAERLRHVVGSETMVARLGGDEFAAFLGDDPTPSRLAEFAQCLHAALRECRPLPDIDLDVSASMGVVTFPDGGSTAAELYERADYALYRAKNRKRGDFVLFSEEHERSRLDLVQVEKQLRRADVGREMDLVYQPVIDATLGRTIGFEALARWRSPLLGDISPGVFIHAAERLRVISPIGEALLGKALAEAATWPDDTRIFFNLSPIDLASPRMIEAIVGLVVRSGIPPQRINFEITETAMTRDFDQAAAAVRVLRKSGFRMALDDFGTGFSSLRHLQRLKPDEIKIDRCFVSDLDRDPLALGIIRNVLDLCRSMGLDCIAEGVETEAQASILRSLGCRLMQGYLFARPMPAHAIAAHLARETGPANDCAHEAVAL